MILSLPGVSRTLRLCLPLGCLLLASCGPRMLVEQSPESGLPGSGRYAWSASSDHIPGEENPRVNNDIFAATVQNVIDKALAKRGYSPTEKNQADWLVHYHASIQQETQLVSEPLFRSPPPRVVCGPHTCNSIYGWGFYGPPETVTRTVTFHEGTLILDIHDAKTNKLVWRGTVSDDVNVNRALNEVKLQQALDKLLLKLPATATAAKP